MPMADVPLYVAIVSAAAGLVGATIPQVTTVIRETRKAERDRWERERDRQEQLAHEVRDVCVNLLRAAGELRTLTENMTSYRGDGTRALLGDVRGHAEATRLHAAEVGLRVSGQLAESAYQVAATATDLVGDVKQNIDMDRDVVIGSASVDALVSSIAAFREAATTYARVNPAWDSGAFARLAGERPPGDKAVAPDRLRRPRAWLVLRRRTHRH